MQTRYGKPPDKLLMEEKMTKINGRAQQWDCLKFNQHENLLL
jgi:hypothetical protein